MSREIVKKLDGCIQDAETLLKKVEAKAVRLREAIVTFKAEKKVAENSATRN